MSKELITMDIESAMAFREAKAAEYPEDERNSASVKALGELLGHVNSLPQEHALPQALSNLEKAADNNGSLMERFSEEVLEKSPGGGDLLSRYGFYGEEDHEAFCQRLAESIHALLNKEAAMLCETCKQHLAAAAQAAGSQPRLVVLDCRTHRKVAPLQLDGQGDVEGSIYDAPTAEQALGIIHQVRQQLPVGERFLVLTGCAGAH